MPAKILMDKINIVDVESTCWQGTQPKTETSEIIEIGICPVDLKTAKAGTAEAILVCPQRSTVSQFCTQLTGITQDMVVEDGMYLGDACRDMITRFQTDTHPWASYGDYDRTQFSKNCSLLKVGYPFSHRHLNVKSLIAQVSGWECEVGMDEALRRLGLKMVQPHHRGGSDAQNIANIYALIVECYRASKTMPASDRFDLI